MRFYEQLNQYMKVVNCTAKELCRMFIRNRLNSFALPLKRSH